MDKQTPIVEFKNVTKEYKLFKNDRQRLFQLLFKKSNYKKNRATDNVSFKIFEGETVAFFGKNGAGKSTILKMITQVSFPTSGEIVVNGRVSALLELTAGFDPEFSGRENIYLRGRISGLSDDEIDALLPAIIDFANIGEYLDQPTRTYSSGMKARLGFAININIDPEILIVDEVLAVGDVTFKKKCRNKIDELVNKKHVTLLFVTHDANTAKQFCSRGIVMNKGKMIFDGDIDAASEKYQEIIS